MGRPTELLHSWKGGDEAALNQIIELLYGDLKSAALNQLRRQTAHDKYQPTELVHEAFLKLHRLDELDWQDRIHFIAVASTVMRQVLMDVYRRDNADKRAHSKITLVTGHLEDTSGAENYEFGTLLQVLDELALVSKEFTQIVELKFFGGLTNAEIATLQNKSESTVKRQWRAARAWLQDRLKAEQIQE